MDHRKIPSLKIVLASARPPAGITMNKHKSGRGSGTVDDNGWLMAEEKRGRGEGTSEDGIDTRHDTGRSKAG
jgi:hypothetical protein